MSEVTALSVLPRVTELKTYTVVIPFQDPRIIDIAPAFLKDKWFVQFERGIDGTDPNDARLKAISRFTNSPAGKQALRGRKLQGGPEARVLIQDDLFLTVPQ